MVVNLIVKRFFCQTLPVRVSNPRRYSFYLIFELYDFLFFPILNKRPIIKKCFEFSMYLCKFFFGILKLCTVVAVGFELFAAKLKKSFRRLHFLRFRHHRPLQIQFKFINIIKLSLRSGLPKSR